MTIIKFEISKKLSLELKTREFYFNHPARGTRKTRVFKTFHKPSITVVFLRIFPSPTATPTLKSSAASMEQECQTRSLTMIIPPPSSPSDTLSPRKFRIVCHSDPTVFVIINTHVDDGGVIHTWPTKYAETLEILSKRYPGTLDETSMDRYLGMGFSYNEDTGAITCSMYHAVAKILASCRTDSLAVQPNPYTMDLFDPSTDLTPVNSKSYQSVTGGFIWLLKLRIEIQLAVIMACTHNSAPTQGDLIKVLLSKVILAYLKGAADLGPTFYTTDGPVLIASTDAGRNGHLAVVQELLAQNANIKAKTNVRYMHMIAMF